jgi:hypothetical protein
MLRCGISTRPVNPEGHELITRTMIGKRPWPAGIVLDFVATVQPQRGASCGMGQIFLSLWYTA